ncbi:cation diffusion facilitator family transporter [Butyricicoccus sp.]|uniref:cation diffusion facilitator family transporter n=1 Tax=Butyricicoccus sp. TaxID=2049021 RepID=UPI003734D2F8
MTHLLIRLFVPGADRASEQTIRLRYGQLAGIVGITANVLLCLVKLLAGIVTHSISVMADAVNNLTDALSSVISLISFHLSGKEPDKEHPFGYGRTEYIAGLFVSMLIIFVGFQFVKSSAERILHPSAVLFSWSSILLLVVSMLVKLWLGLFNRRIGKAIDSPVLMAAMQDSLNDVITTGVVVLGMIASRFTTLPVDGYVGIVVAAFILYAGYGLAKDALSPLIGEKADPELVQEIHELVTSYDDVLGIHDLIAHNYGAGRWFASVHAEVPSDGDMIAIHETIDAIEQQALKSLNVFLVIHMDPIEINNERVQTVRSQTEQVLHAIDPTLSMHDFRMVDGEHQINLIFDVVVDRDFVPEELRTRIRTELHAIDPRFNPVIVFDHTM